MESEFNSNSWLCCNRKLPISIILYSNMIATTSDVVQTAIKVYADDENAIKNFDLGGFLVTVYRLITDTKCIQKIKEEFIFNEWDRIIESKNNIFNI